MPEISSIIPIQVDLDAGLAAQPLRMTLAAGNANAHTLRFTALRSGIPVDLSGVQVSGACLRADGSTVPLAGSIVNGAAVLKLSAACYAVPGLARLSLTLTYGSVTATHLLAILQVDATTTDLIVDPEGVLPSLAELLAEIDNMRAATAAAEEAAAQADAASAALARQFSAALTNIATPIIQHADGSSILSVSDSAERPLVGLRLYGKTTQDGTPTPESPVEPVHAGADGAVSVMLAGKNLFQDRRSSKADYTSNGITFVTNADGTFTANGTNDTTTRSSMTLTTGSRWLYLPAGTYTISSGLPNSDGYFQVSYNDEMVSAGSAAVYAYATPKTFTIDKPKYAWMAINVAAGKTVENLVFKPQIEVGAVATEYEPYQEYQTMTAATPNGLPGLPVTSGGNYIDSTGQQWICDEIDFTRGTYIKRIGILTMDGSQLCGWNTYPTMPNGGYLICYLPAGDVADPLHIASAISDSFINRAGQAAGLFDHGSFRLTEDGSALTFSLDGVSNTSAAMQWFKEHPATFLYVREHPAGDFLSDDELTAFAALTAHEPHMTLFNDGDAGMALSYIADTKRYIDNKFAALAAASVNA